MGKTENKAVLALDELVAALHARGRLRIWSLVVTVFGDAIVPRGGNVGLSVLQQIMARFAIENGALRTAMSRLAADGWVVREKSGRNSIYTLAASGRRAFDEATRRIYAAGPPEWDGKWTVAVTPNGAIDGELADELRAAGFVEAGAATWLRPDLVTAWPMPGGLENVLVLTSVASNVPARPHEFWHLRETAAAYRAFVSGYSRLHAALEGGDKLEPLDAIAARSLLIHDWRRIVLQDPCLPSELLPEDWSGENARATVRSIYAKLGAASEQWLDEAGLPPQTDPTRFAERFGIFQSSR